MDAVALALLGVIVGVLLWRAVTRDRREYSRFKRLRSTIARQKVYRRWLVEGALSLSGLSLAAIVGAWEQIPLVLADAQAWQPVAATRAFLAGEAGTIIAVAASIVVLAVLVLPILVARTSLDEAPAIGDIRALLPRSRGELPYGAALSVNAGVFEELLFRVGVPALVFAVTADAVVAFLVATILFGILHVYQGAAGIVFSTLLGALFVALYVVTGSIVAPIVLHIIVDVRSMVLIPIVIGRVTGARAA